MTWSRRLVRRYYLVRTTNSAGFYLPVAVLYLQDRGFGLDFIGFAYAVFALGTLAAEIPSGYLGDWLGRRASLAIGAALRVLVLAAYPFVAAPAAFLALHVVWATGRAFRSGTQDAWLYELLAARFDEGEFARVESRGSAALLVTSAVGAVAGGLLYTVNPAYPFLANAALAALGVPLLATFPAVARAGGPGASDQEPDAGGASEGTDAGGAPADRERLTVRGAVRLLRRQAGRPAVRWLVAYAALFHGLFVITRVYEQPALDAVGVPVAGFGLLYAGFKLVSAGAASTVGRLHDRLGTCGVFGLLVPVYGLAYAGVAVEPALVVPVLFCNRSMRVVTAPVRNQYLNDRLGGVGRATVLSGASMVLAFVGAVARLVAAPVAAAIGPVSLLPTLGVPLVVAAAALWFLVSPVRDDGGAGAAGHGDVAPTD